MSFHYRYRKQIIIIVLIIITLTALIATTLYFYEPKKEEKISSIKLEKKDNKIINEKTKEIEKTTYMIDIKGEVVSPGIYELENTSRVIDVINKAGGLTKNADTTVINLSKKI